MGLGSLAVKPEKPVAMPMSYVHDQLCQRWSIDPERLADLDAETILRGLEFMRIEASVVVKHEGKSSRG